MVASYTGCYGTYDSYVSAKSNGQTMAAKYKQWSEDTNASTRAALKAAGLQSSQIEGSEQTYVQLKGWLRVLLSRYKTKTTRLAALPLNASSHETRHTTALFI